MIDYTELKSGMADAGFPVSEGEGWTVEDQKNYRDYCYLKWNGMVPNKDVFALAYPGLAPENFPGAGDSPEPPGDLVLESIALTGETDIQVGGTSQLTATGTYDDESTADITADSTFASSDEEVVTVSASGLVTAVSAGTADITASNGEITSPALSITVTDVAATIVSIAISGTNTVVEGNTTTLVATATMSDDSTEDVTSTAIWESSSEATATVAAGVVTGIAEGTTNITASVDEVSSSAFEVTVTAV